MQQTTIKQFLYGYDQMKVYIITFVSDLLTFPFFVKESQKYLNTNKINSLSQCCFSLNVFIRQMLTLYLV
jgi:hypothetical protein